MTTRPIVEPVLPAALQPVAVTDRKIHVCYLLGSLRDGGTERQALELMRGLDKQRFEVSVILFEEDGVERLSDVAQDHCILGIPQQSSKWLRGMTAWTGAAARMYSCFRLWRPDVIHAFLAGPSGLGVWPARLARVPAFIGSRRSMLADYRRGRRVASFADDLAFKLSDVNVGNCGAVSDEMVSAGRCRPNKCATIYNGVDTEKFHPSVQPRWRKELDWEENLVLGLVANFYPYKRHTDFVQAASLIHEKHPEARFVMVGADYGTKSATSGQIKELGLDSKIKLLERVPPEQVFAGLDVLVCPSETEGCSNVLLEAMASGKPVIATRVGGNPEIVVDGQTGFLIPPFSPQAIADAADRLISNRMLRLMMGERGRRRAVDHFSLGAMIAAHERLYLQLLHRNPRP